MSDEVIKSNALPGFDTGLACLVMLTRFHNFAASEYAEDGRLFGLAEMLSASKKLCLKAKLARGSLSLLSHIPQLAIASENDGHYFIIARLDDSKALAHDRRA